MSEVTSRVKENNKKTERLEKNIWGEGSSDKPESSQGGAKRGSEYKRQLLEKQRLKKRVYKLREKQFKRFFKMAANSHSGETGENLLILLERRLDNVVFRLKLALSRKHARQMIVHGHFRLNGAHVKSPSLLVKQGDVISFVSDSPDLKTAFASRLASSIRVPDWLEIDSDGLRGSVVRLPLRIDIPTKAEMSLIVEFYSK